MRFLRRWRRERARKAPFPAAWKAVIDRNLPLARALPAELRAELEWLVGAFLREKRFEGVRGVEVTDEMRVTIAAQACLLLVGMRDHDLFPMMRTVIIYPSAYVARGRVVLPGGLVLEHDGGRLGESWQRGPVVLAWDSALVGGLMARDGHNVVLHEFAHQLDAEFGGMEGAPELASRRDYREWSRVFGREFDRLRASLQRGEPTLLDPYGATSPAEFFAVATETFYERPRALRERHPELYGQLAKFYGVDPASWAPESAASS